MIYRMIFIKLMRNLIKSCLYHVLLANARKLSLSDERYNPYQGARFELLASELYQHIYFHGILAKLCHFGTHISETISLIFSNFRKALEFVSFHMVFGFYFIFDNNMVALGCLFIYLYVHLKSNIL